MALPPGGGSVSAPEALEPPSSLASGPGERDLVSVIVPTHNRGYIIERALDSVLAQSHRALEVLVVDDGSADDTRRRVEKYGSNVRYVPRPNGGVSAARNTGLALATGEFIALLDSDDAWLPWKLEAQVAFLRARPGVGMVWTDMAAVDEDGRVVSPAYLRTMYGAYRKTRLDRWLRPVGTLRDLNASVPPEQTDRTAWEGDLFSAMFLGNMVHTSTVLLRRERLRAVGGFDESLRPSGEDYDFHWRTCREGPVGFLDAATILYRVKGSDQLTAPAYMPDIARNNLRTLENRLASDRSRLALPGRTIRRQLASAHTWLGAELLLGGGRPGSTRHLARGLAMHPLRPRVAVLLLFSLLPFAVLRTVRAAKRAALRTPLGRFRG